MDKIVVIFRDIKNNTQADIEVPLDITANDLILSLNKAYDLGINVNDITQCYLSAENPIALLRGNKTLRESRLRNGTVINFVR